VVTRIIERPAASLGPDDLVGLLPPQPMPAPAEPPFLPPQAQIYNSEERVSASRVVNPSMTVPKGTIVAAVLETALDSSRAGGVRAIVSRDVRSFDGSRVLIPRGSRLYGEYAADVSAGQKRAMIEWHRLLRPDGVTIELASPSADPLGRAGVEGKVHSNFFARFGGAILQSVLDMGVALATGAVTDNAVIVNVPQSTQQVVGQALPPPPQPRISIDQGTSVSVFVARDLDFSTVDG
jgi:type IV secretion system protein VirB10